MNSVMQRFRRAALTVGAVGLALFGQSALAAGADTNAGTSIGNRATVSYTVGGVAQAPIQSSPTGNTTATGADTTFVVDRRLNFTAAEVGATATIVSPGQLNQVTTFTITNTTNGAVGFVLTPANIATAVFGNADAFDVANVRVFVDGNANGTYDGADAATSVASLAEDATITVFVVADVPLAAGNAQAANVRLTVQATAENTTTVLTQNAGVDDPAVVDTVFNDAGNDNSEFADDGYLVSSAALSVAKTLTMISDPVTGVSANAKPIPGAVVEYAVAITNAGGAPATGVTFVDDLSADLTLAQATYDGGAANVSIAVAGSATTFCTAEAGGTDTNGDGCVLVGNQLRVIPTAAVTVGNTAPNNVATFTFRVTID